MDTTCKQLADVFLLSLAPGRRNIHVFEQEGTREEIGGRPVEHPGGEEPKKMPADRPKDSRQWPELTSEDKAQMDKVMEELIESINRLTFDEERRKEIQKRLS